MVNFPDKDFINTASLTSMLEMAKGNVPDHSTVNKFGRNTAIDTAAKEDVWDGGGIWVAPTQARIHDIVSTSENDVAAGVGARTVKVYGLLDWDIAEVSESIILNGIIDVPTVNAYVIIHRIEVLTKGATSVNVGIITATAQTDATVTAQINAGEGQTQMAIYGIPSIQTVYIGRLYANTNKGGGAVGLTDISLVVNPEPDVELLNFVDKHVFGLNSAANSALTINYYVPKVIIGPAIIKMDGAVSVSNTDISAGFDLILVTN